MDDNKASEKEDATVTPTEEMTFDEFSAAVLRYESVVSEPRSPIPVPWLFQTLRLFTVAAALLDQYKKAVFYGKPLSRKDMREKHLEARHLVQTLIDWTRTESTPTLLSGVSLLDTSLDRRQNMRAFHALLGYCTEAGEVGEALYVALRRGRPLDTINVEEEFADGDWYKAVWFDVTGHRQGAALRRVAFKLKTRFKWEEGYSDKGALGRDLPAERAAMERAAEPTIHIDSSSEALGIRVAAWPIRGVRVEGDKVVLSVRGGNDAARWLCAEVLSLMGQSAAGAAQETGQTPPPPLSAPAASPPQQEGKYALDTDTPAPQTPQRDEAFDNPHHGHAPE